MRRPILALLSLLLATALVACSPSHSFEAGRPLDEADLESMSAALFHTETADPAETDVPGTVYWTEDGQVYHRDRNCPYLAKSASVKSGPLNNAVLLYGKDRPCSVCGEE